MQTIIISRKASQASSDKCEAFKTTSSIDLIIYKYLVSTL